ncbi:MAG: RdgB/HAM1 family non-canonical purine NTP pyrophosphatase [Abditibacteriaceae bacterium]
MKLVIATSNPGKLREMQALLTPALSWEIVSLADFPPFEMPPEDGETMAQNARIKAVFCTRQLQLPCLADDSGLEVDALNGEPGVRSARWFPGNDQDRNAALLARLQDVPANQRTARFRCALCLAMNENNLHQAEATCEGRIALSPRGENGFGYDPVFEISNDTCAKSSRLGQTIAELTSLEKAELSHRARAVTLLLNNISQN